MSTTTNGKSPHFRSTDSFKSFSSRNEVEIPLNSAASPNPNSASGLGGVPGTLQTSFSNHFNSLYNHNHNLDPKGKNKPIGKVASQFTSSCCSNLSSMSSMNYFKVILIIVLVGLLYNFHSHLLNIVTDRTQFGVSSKVLYPHHPKDARLIYDSEVGTQYRVAIVADLDRMSIDATADPKKPRWKSVLKFATLTFNEDLKSFSVQWKAEDEHVLTTYLGEAGRGLELSELIYWKGRLLTFDDRSGVVFELVRNMDGKYIVIPNYILTEGQGATSKGQKTEWATIKHGDLYVGSFGKEFTGKDGSVLHTNNMWINVIDKEGDINHYDWTEKYNLIREGTNTGFPGYMIHEAIHYNEVTKEWFVLPRRVSSDPYDEKLDEKKGSNLLIILDDKFQKVKRVVRIGEVVPERGFSSFKFLPGSDGKVIAALKTVEEEDKTTGISKQNSFITVFDVNGNVLLRDSPIPGDYKFEGLEFVEI